MPPIDSVSMLDVLLTPTAVSPRVEIFMDSSCLIQGDWKLLTGKVSSASWAGETYPNASSAGNVLFDYTADCSNGCLYNVGEAGDMTEHVDEAHTQASRLAAMMARLKQLRQGIWTAKDCSAYNATCQDPVEVANAKYGSFMGPFCLLGDGE
jgi:hypothetical protein